MKPGKRLHLNGPFLHLVITLMRLCVVQAQPAFAQSSGKLMLQCPLRCPTNLPAAPHPRHRWVFRPCSAPPWELPALTLIPKSLESGKLTQCLKYLLRYRPAVATLCALRHLVTVPLQPRQGGIARDLMQLITTKATATAPGEPCRVGTLRHRWEAGLRFPLMHLLLVSWLRGLGGDVARDSWCLPLRFC